MASACFQCLGTSVDHSSLPRQQNMHSSLAAPFARENYCICCTWHSCQNQICIFFKVTVASKSRGFHAFLTHVTNETTMRCGSFALSDAILCRQFLLLWQIAQLPPEGIEFFRETMMHCVAFNDCGNDESRNKADILKFSTTDKMAFEFCQFVMFDHTRPCV